VRLKKLPYVVILLVLVEVAFGTGAPDSDYAGPKDLFMAGAAAIITQNPHKGVGTESHVIPMFLYSRDRFSLYGPMASYTFLVSEGGEIRGLGRMRFEGYEDDDSSFLRGMDDREWTLELGGALSKAFDWGELAAACTADILGEHEGYELRLSYSYDFRAAFNIPDLMLTPNIGVNYRSRQLNDYYYGVRAAEATALRPQYHVGDSTGLLTGVRANYRLAENWSLMGMVSLQWLGDEITDSPIVDEHYMASFLLGIMYQF
jgi:outer membrane protein